MKAQKKQQRKIKTAKSKSNLGFKKEMLGKLVSKKPANLNKGKGKKERQKKQINPQRG